MQSKSKFLIGLLIIVSTYLVFSLTTYKDYGITADEEIEYKSGKALLEYYKTGRDPTNAGISERQLPTKSLYFRGYQAILSLLNQKGYYERYHLLNLTFALILFIVFYGILFYEYSDLLISLTGALALFLTPRFLGDIPGNPKDMPFAVIYFLSLISIYLVQKFRVGKFAKILILGFLFGISSSMRLIGLSLFPICLAFTIIKWRENREKNLKTLFNELTILFLIFTASIFLMLLIWPAFRLQFPLGAVNVFSNASNFENWNNTNLFFGSFLTKYQRPQMYLPVWLLITTPMFVLAPLIFTPLFLKIKTKRHDLILLMLGAAAINLLLYFLFRPVIYNGLRHFLFLIPILTFCSFVIFIDSLKLFHTKKVLLMLLLVWILNMVFTAKDMFSLHPYEYVYFNELIGGIKGAKSKFDLDYWGASYKQAAEWVRTDLIQSGAQTKVKVYACNVSYAAAYYAQGKFELVNKSAQADYIICDYDNDLYNRYDFTIAYVIDRWGVPLNIIRKVK